MHSKHSSNRCRNPELMRTVFGATTPGRRLLRDDGSEICHCAGVRKATSECLAGLKDSSEPPEIIEKKRNCALGVL